MHTRLAQLEGDLLAMRAQIDSIHTTTRRLQGKVYKGVQLGDTVDAVEPPGNGDSVPNSTGNPHDLSQKSELYRRAAKLRRR